jgi:hypothetical protein
VRSRSGIAIAYAGAALIGMAGILLSVIVFFQTAHGFGSQSSRPPVASSPRTLPGTGPSTPAPAGGLAATRGPARTTGSGGQASRLYSPGEPPGDVEDEPSPAPSAAGPVAGLPLPAPHPAATALPVPSPPLIP